MMVTIGLVLLNPAGFVLNAQSPQTIEVGPHIGATTYAGDLNVWRNLDQWDWKSLKQFHYDLGAVVRYNYDSRWSFRLDYSHFKVRAGDAAAAWRPQSLLNFQSTVDDLSLMTEFNFLNYYTGKRDKAFSPYIFAGLSGLMYYVQPFTGDKTIDAWYLNKLKDANGVDQFEVGDKRKGHNYALSIPFGVGLKISLSEHLATTVEWRMHATLTDYLDGVSGNYAADNQHVLLVATYKRNDYGEILYSQGKPILLDYRIETKSPRELDPDLALVYDFTDPSGTFYDPAGHSPVNYNKVQRGNIGTKDWFGMLNVSLTWKFVLPEKSACKMTEQ